MFNKIEVLEMAKKDITILDKLKKHSINFAISSNHIRDYVGYYDAMQELKQLREIRKEV